MKSGSLVAILCFALAACEGSVSYVGGDGETDGATDTSVDTAVDPGADTSVDTAVDPSVDVAPDPILDPEPTDPAPDVTPDPTPDPSPDTGPDGGLCIPEGCLLTEGGAPCCAGLSAQRECPPTDPDCAPDLFCIDCGDGSCDPHENRYNCWMDCGMGCDSDVAMSYACSPIETHSCFCEPPGCRPECIASSSGESAWMDPCSGEIIREARCEGQYAVCDAIGSFSEGWYESETGELIDWALCAAEWSCSIIW